MTTPDKLTLDNVKKTIKKHEYRASDFLTNEQMEEVHESNIKGKKNNSFDAVDAYIAEILARFGYDAFVAWKFGEISQMQMAKYIEAERARDARDRLITENVIVASMAGANNSYKGHMPRSLRAAIQILKKEEKLAKGGK